jgi:hypothetical protein
VPRRRESAVQHVSGTERVADGARPERVQMHERARRLCILSERHYRKRNVRIELHGAGTGAVPVSRLMATSPAPGADNRDRDTRLSDAA